MYINKVIKIYHNVLYCMLFSNEVIKLLFKEQINKLTYKNSKAVVFQL